MPRLTVAIAALALASAFALHPGPARGEDWTVTRFAVEYVVAADAVGRVVEDIEVDFGRLESHGIYRDLVTDIPCEAFLRSAEETVPCEAGRNRHYEYADFDVRSVDPRGAASPIPWLQESGFHGIRIRIGDPNVTVVGVQRYRITYTLRGALDPLGTHDQFFWNVMGRWETTVREVTARVRLESGDSPGAVACYEGSPTNSRACSISGPEVAPVFSSTGPISPGEELTVRLTWPKGVLAVPPPLYSRDPSLGDLFTLDMLELAGSAVLAIAAVAATFALWYTKGRDRRYTTIHYLTGDTTETTPGLLAPDDIVVEYTPPDRLRPAQLAMVVNERATPRDVTATLVDLAVRGYLRINEEIDVRRFAPDEKDWRLERRKGNDADLLPYEAKLLDGLFQGGKGEVTVSSLKQKFAARMAAVQKEIVRDAVRRNWFTSSPGTVRGMWLGVGLGTAAAGVGLSFLVGLVAARALLGLPVVLLGLGIAAVSPAMARRTAAGAEARRRALGFRLYVSTAETRIQEFNEQRNLFAAYLPYAIAFECVDKWANAFKGLADEAAQTTTSWYHGAGAFSPLAFGAGISAFSSGVSTSLARSASSSSGGSVGSFGGGGGGGGGGGRW